MKKWRAWFCYTVGTVIVLCFVESFIVDQVEHKDMPAAMYTLMGLVAGGVFGIPLIRSERE